MLLCVSMLVGTTFAWFTDTATTGVNTIVAGNLDVVLEYWNGTDWVEVNEQTKLFNEDAKYEPGFTEVAYLRIRNNGSLSLKYDLKVNVTNEVAGKTKDGKPIKLSEHLKFGVITSALNKDVEIFETRAKAVAAVEGIATGLKSYSTNGYVELAPEGYYTMALVVFMPTTVGNEANHDGVNVPSIDLGVSLFATQKDAESDSFGNNYDKNAPTLITVDGSSVAYATINEAVEKNRNATTFNVSGPIDINAMSNAFADGETITFKQIEGAIPAYYDFSGTTAMLSTKGASIVIDGGYIQGKRANESSGYGFQGTAGTITYNGVTINDSWTNENEATVVYNGCTFTGSYYLNTYSVPNITITGCTFDKEDSRAVLIYSHGNAPINATITGCTFVADAKGHTGTGAWTAAVEVDASHIIDGATVNITDCTFDANYNGIVRDKAGVYATITVDNVPVVFTQAAFANAIANKEASIILAAGNYTMVNTDYDVTISGSEATFLNLKANSCDANGNTITFKGITIVGEDDIGGWYTEQLKNAKKVIYEDCTINGLITAYAPSEFTDCVFNNTFNDEYSVYCYAGGVHNFTNCTFNTACSKAIKVYDEEKTNANKTVNVTNCNFVATATDKAAVEIDSRNITDNSKYTVKINNCTTNEYYEKLWADKGTKSDVYIDGVKYVAPVTDPAKVQEALTDPKQSSVKVDVGNDVTINNDGEKVNVPDGKELTIDSGKIDASNNGIALSAGKNSTITLNDGNFTAHEYAQVINAQAEGSKVIVNGGKLEGNYLAFVASNAQVTVNGGEFATDSYPATVLVATHDDNNTSVVTITGGTFYSEAICDNFVRINITGGTFYLNGITNYPALDFSEYFVISGGTFSVDPTEYLADGCVAAQEGDMWVVSAQ